MSLKEIQNTQIEKNDNSYEDEVEEKVQKSDKKEANLEGGNENEELVEDKLELTEINPGAPNVETSGGDSSDKKIVEATIQGDLLNNTITYPSQNYKVTAGFHHSASDSGEIVQVKIPDIFIASKSDISCFINEGSLEISEPYLEGAPFSEKFEWQGGYWVIDVSMPEDLGYSELIIQIKSPNYPQNSTLADMGVDEGYLPVGIYSKDSTLAKYDQQIEIPKFSVGEPSMSVLKDNRINFTSPQYTDLKKYTEISSLPELGATGFGKLTTNSKSNTILLSIAAPYAVEGTNKPAKDVEGEFILPKELDVVPSGTSMETPTGYFVQSEKLEIDAVTGLPTGSALGAQFVQYTEGRGSSDKWIETIEQEDGSKKITFHTDSLDYNRRIYYEIPVVANSVNMVEGYKYPQYVTTSKAKWNVNGNVETRDNLYVYQTLDKIVPTSYSANKKITNNKELWTPGDVISYQIEVNVLKDNLSINLPDYVDESTPIIENSIDLKLNDSSENVKYNFDKLANSINIEAENLKTNDKLILNFDVSTDNVDYGSVVKNTFNLFGTGNEAGYLQGNTVQAEFEAAPVTVKYQDEEGNELSPDVTLNGKVGLPYESSAASINGWTVKTVPSNATGTFSKDPQEVIYIYERTEAAKEDNSLPSDKESLPNNAISINNEENSQIETSTRNNSLPQTGEVFSFLTFMIGVALLASGLFIFVLRLKKNK